MELVTNFFTVLLYIVNKHECNMFTMYSFFNKLFTVTGSNNTIIQLFFILTQLA